jgi:hypothetical protein
MNRRAFLCLAPAAFVVSKFFRPANRFLREDATWILARPCPAEAERAISDLMWKFKEHRGAPVLFAAHDSRCGGQVAELGPGDVAIHMVGA